jgi:transposase
VNRYKKENGLANEEKKETDDLQTELKRLRKENARLKMEREILKKATAYFAKETL